MPGAKEKQSAMPLSGSLDQQTAQLDLISKKYRKASPPRRTWCWGKSVSRQLFTPSECLMPKKAECTARFIWAIKQQLACQGSRVMVNNCNWKDLRTPVNICCRCSCVDPDNLGERKIQTSAPNLCHAPEFLCKGEGLLSLLIAKITRLGRH